MSNLKAQDMYITLFACVERLRVSLKETVLLLYKHDAAVTALTARTTYTAWIDAVMIIRL